MIKSIVLGYDTQKSTSASALYLEYGSNSLYIVVVFIKYIKIFQISLRNLFSLWGGSNRRWSDRVILLDLF